MNVLIVGLGSIGRKHLQVLKEIKPNITLFALRSKQSKVEEGINNIYSLKDLPKNLDFAIIATPTIFHKSSIKNLLPLQIPLFIEKPVLHKIDSETSQIADYLKRNNIFTYIGCNLRFHPCIVFLKKYLQEINEQVNEVNIYCGSFLPDWRPNRDFRKTYSAKTELGGGVHLDLIHELDYTYYIWGVPSRVNSILCSKSSLNIDAIDYAHYTLEYPTFTAAVTLNYYRKQSKRTIEVVLEKTILLVDIVSSTITDENGNLVFSEKTDQLKTLKLQMEYFLNAFHSSKTSINSFEESLNVLKICTNQ